MAPENDAIRQILADTRRIAVVGISANPARPSHGVFGFLVRQGFDVVGVNPGLAGQTVHGRPVVATLADALAEAGPLDLVDIFRNSTDAGPVIDEAVRLGARTVWTQLGVRNEPAAARARAAGLRVVTDRCPAIEWNRLGLPAKDMNGHRDLNQH